MKALGVALLDLGQKLIGIGTARSTTKGSHLDSCQPELLCLKYTVELVLAISESRISVKDHEHR